MSQLHQPSYSVIIPTYNAEKSLDDLLSLLHNQTIKPFEIIIIDSQSTDQTKSIATKWGERFIPIQKSDFDHGGTRNIAVSYSSTDYFLLMTQDALPVNSKLFENLYSSFVEDSSVAVSFARQIPYDNSSSVEKLTRQFNYPLESNIRSMDDINKYGIKTFFLSDVCALYSREKFEIVGGFTSPVLTNEDMLIASSFLHHGYKIAYQSSAVVYHSHNYSLIQQYKRNFDIGAFLSMYADRFPVKNEIGEGLKMIKFATCTLLQQFKFISVFCLFISSFAKFLGNRAGRNYKKYSLDKILRKTNYPLFWKKYFDQGLL